MQYYHYPGPRVSVAEKIEDDRENVRAFLALLHTLIMIIVTVMMMKGNYTHTVLVTMMRSVMVKWELECIDLKQ